MNNLNKIGLTKNITSKQHVLQFLPYQQKWLQDSARFKIGLFARQTGKTFVNCAEILKECIKAEQQKVKTRWIILSRGERQARETMTEHLIPLASAFEKLYSASCGYPFPKLEKTQNEIRFEAGSKVSILPANPDTARGFSANLFLDEFAFHKNSRQIWRALFPVISKNGLKIRIASTPNGTANMFFRLMCGDEKHWSKHRVDIFQAVQQGLPRNIQELKDSTLDEYLWRQEYELDWMDGSTRWLDRNIIINAQNKHAAIPQLFKGGQCWIGNDIARKNDLWVAVAIEKVNNKFWIREIQAEKSITFAEQDKRLDRMVERYKPIKIAMDATGIGLKPVEDAQKRYGKNRTSAVNFTKAKKLELATLIKKILQEKKLKIPTSQKLFDDLHAMRASISGNSIQFNTSSADLTDGNADRFWAIALALFAAQQQSTSIGMVRSIRSIQAHSKASFFT